MPRIGICEKCRHWCEYCGLYTENRTAVLWVGCMLQYGPHSETTFSGVKYSALKKCIAGNAHGNKKPCGCYNGSPTFRDVSELVRNEYDVLRKEVEGSQVSKECPYYAEQKMEEWSK